MSKPLSNGPYATTIGDGRYGVTFVRFVLSGAPGGYSALEFVNLFPTRHERDVYARELRHKHRPNRQRGPVIVTFEVN